MGGGGDVVAVGVKNASFLLTDVLRGLLTGHSACVWGFASRLHTTDNIRSDSALGSFCQESIVHLGEEKSQTSSH